MIRLCSSVSASAGVGPSRSSAPGGSAGASSSATGSDTTRDSIRLEPRLVLRRVERPVESIKRSVVRGAREPPRLVGVGSRCRRHGSRCRHSGSRREADCLRLEQDIAGGCGRFVDPEFEDWRDVAQPIDRDRGLDDAKPHRRWGIVRTFLRDPQGCAHAKSACRPGPASVAAFRGAIQVGLPATMIGGRGPTASPGPTGTHLASRGPRRQPLRRRRRREGFRLDTSPWAASSAATVSTAVGPPRSWASRASTRA